MVFKLYSKDQDLEEAVFMAAMYWRIAYGSLRIFIGYKLLSFVGLPVIDVYQLLLRKEFVEDPHDAGLRLVAHTLAHHGFSVTYFLVAYFVFWGVIDIILSISMLRHELWAFSAAMVLIGLFVLYEGYRFTHTHSPVLLAFILIDIFIVYLIRHEQHRLKVRHARKLQTVSG